MDNIKIKGDKIVAIYGSYLDDDFDSTSSKLEKNKLISKLFNITYKYRKDLFHIEDRGDTKTKNYYWEVIFTPKNPDSVIYDINLTNALNDLDTDVLSAIKEELKTPKKLSKIINDILAKR